MAVGSHAVLTETVTLSATATQYRGVLMSGAAVSAGGAGYPAATGGVSGDLIPVVMLGVAIGEAGAAVAVNDLLEFDSSGRYITRTSGTIVGRALSAASAAGVQMEVFVIPH